MYSKILCDKCKLTIYANTEEELESLSQKFKCKCGEEEEKVVLFYVGSRRLCSRKNIKAEADDYESGT